MVICTFVSFIYCLSITCVAGIFLDSDGGNSVQNSPKPLPKALVC